MKPSLVFLTAALSVFGTAATANACEVSGVGVVGGAVDARYDVFSSSDLAAPVRLTSASNPECAGTLVRLRIVADETDPNAVTNNGLQLSNGATTLAADITDRGGARLGRIGSVGASPVFRLNAAGALDVSELTLTMPRGQRSAPGSYIGRFKILTETLDDGGNVTSSQAESAAVMVDVTASVSLAATTGATLDLGEIQAGGRSLKPLSFRAYANTPYEISITSDNGFTLVRGVSTNTPAIPYTPVLSDVVLPSGEQRSRDFSSPGTAGYKDHILDVEVPNLQLRAAGDYHDYLTVRIRALVTG